MRIASIVLFFLLAMLAWSSPARAARSFDNCKGFITSVPAVISSPGTWCLKQDVTTAITSGDAITVSVNNVILDCNDFRLDGVAAGLGTTALGVHALNHKNVTVRNCKILGFYRGVYFEGSGGGHVIEDNHFDKNVYEAAFVHGDGSVIRHNLATDTGGSTVTAAANGIGAAGGVDMIDNTIDGLFVASGSGGSVIGIDLNSNSTGSVIGNRVQGLLSDGGGEQDGIEVGPNSRVAIRRNELVSNGVAPGFGVTCGDARVREHDNTISGFATNYDGICGDAGENDFVP